jgi:alginate O-acetyltransferase complex protein AlgI
MLFNSYSFIYLFLPIAFFGMFLVGRYSQRLAALWLGLASLAFYAVWDARYVTLLLASITLNFGAGYWISLHRARESIPKARRTLITAIAANLALLAYFKYSNFFLGSANQLFGTHIPALDIILPLGISFFTFTQIAFLVDVYRGIAREYNFLHYLLFVTYFPHLIAGPVLHHKQMMPQFANPATYRINPEHVAVGITIFVLGLAKKVLLADSLGEHANGIFAAAHDGQALRMLEAWIGALAYTLQLYFDFSGYSDMAIGLSLMFNVRLPMNFDSPYKATSIIEFWRRWHMTLSTFLREYLYIPLGGNRKGKLRRYTNLMITMLLGGLWHGAGWTFLVWGGLHGFYLLVNHGWRDVKARFELGDGGRLGKLAAGALTFLAVVVAWVFFRADSLGTATSMLSSMMGTNGLLQRWVPVRDGLEIILPCLVVVWLLPNTRQLLAAYRPTWEDMAAQPTVHPQKSASWLRWQPSAYHAWVVGGLFFLCVISLNRVSEFLYFQF